MHQNDASSSFSRNRSTFIRIQDPQYLTKSPQINNMLRMTQVVRNVVLSKSTMTDQQLIVNNNKKLLITTDSILLLTS